MNSKLMRLMELCLIVLFSIWAVKASEVNDTTHMALYILAAVLTIVWIVIDTDND